MRHDQALRGDRLPGMQCKGELWFVMHQSVGRILCDVYRCDGCAENLRFRANVKPGDDTYMSANAG